MVSRFLSTTSLTSVALVLAIATSALGQQPHQAQLTKARGYFSMLREGQCEAFVAACDETMRNALPAEKLKEIWASITAGYGPYVREIRAEANPLGDSTIVDLYSSFESTTLRVRITLNKEDKIAGLFFTPSSEGVEYEVPKYVDTSKFREEEVTVSAGELPLPGTLTLPKGAGPFPALVLVHGSGPNDRDETIYTRKPFKDIAWGMASRGIAVLRYDKRAYVHPNSMDMKRVTIDEIATDDAIAAAQLLMTRKEIRSDRIFILGHSLGATAAPYIGKNEERIAGLIMLAAAARPIYDLIDDQVAYLVNVDGKLDEAEKEQIDAVHSVVAKLRSGNCQEDDTLLGAPAGLWFRMNKMAPVVNAKSYGKPMLIVQGGRDYQVSMKDYAIWTKELAGRSHVTLKLFDRMDHLFLAGDGPSIPEQYRAKGHVDASVITFVADWVRAQN